MAYMPYRPYGVWGNVTVGRLAPERWIKVVRDAGGGSSSQGKEIRARLTSSRNDIKTIRTSFEITILYQCGDTPDSGGSGVQRAPLTPTLIEAAENEIPAAEASEQEQWVVQVR